MNIAELRLRPYQQRIVDSIGDSNAIVKMPTGAGKTFVAAEVIRLWLVNRAPHSVGSVSQLALFLVPTCDLVDQQATAMQTWMPSVRIARFRGNLTKPNRAQVDILVSTPQAFLHLQDQESDFQWHNFEIVVFDEVHHVLKDHPYRRIALRLKHWRGMHKHTISSRPQTLGLSASLTYAVGDHTVQQSLQSLSYDLSIEKMVSPSEEQLIQGGYLPQHGNVELVVSHDTPDGVIPVSKRQPHLMFKQFRERIEKKEATQLAIQVWDIIALIEAEAIRRDPTFKSPLDGSKLASWEEYAYKQKSRRAVTGELLYLYEKLELWYVALRLLVQTWEEEQQLVLEWLKIWGSFEVPSWYKSELADHVHKMQRLAYNEYNLMKLSALRQVLLNKSRRFGNSFRAIIFVQQRIAAFILMHYINSDSRLSDAGLSSAFVVSRGSKITPSIKMTPSAADERLSDFRVGKINIIVATSVIEEGFDVPAANVVISFNHLKDSVELCQRFGRARSKDSAIVVMDERPDRPVSRLELVRRQQDRIVSQFDPSQATVNHKQEIEKQESRERSGAKILLNTGRCLSVPLQCLNEYTKKTKAHVQESSTMNSDLFCCTLIYCSILRNVTCSATGSNKKAAKNAAAANLLLRLRDE